MTNRMMQRKKPQMIGQSTIGQICAATRQSYTPTHGTTQVRDNPTIMFRKAL